jgi:hypothetical protein
MSAKEKIKLAFECEQEWEDMLPSACGRFCTLCKKEVHDFRSKSIEEIKRIREKENVCGVYLPEQIDSDLIEIELPFLRKMRYYAAAFATFLGIETAQASAKEVKVPGIEMIASSNAFDHPGPGDHPTGRDSRKKKKVKLSDKKVKGGDEVAKVKRKKKVYLSKRFPFIKIRKKRRVIAGGMGF